MYVRLANNVDSYGLGRSKLGRHRSSAQRAVTDIKRTRVGAIVGDVGVLQSRRVCGSALRGHGSCRSAMPTTQKSRGEGVVDSGGTLTTATLLDSHGKNSLPFELPARQGWQCNATITSRAVFGYPSSTSYLSATFIR